MVRGDAGEEGDLLLGRHGSAIGGGGDVARDGSGRRRWMPPWIGASPLWLSPGVRGVRGKVSEEVENGNDRARGEPYIGT